MDTRLYTALILGILGIFSVIPTAVAQGLPQDPYGARLSCPDDAQVPAVRNENGMSLTQVPGGVVGKAGVIQGQVIGGTASGLLVQVQHNRTKAVTTFTPAGALKADGRFELSIPLPQLGSYTIVIQALRVGGAPSIITTAMSRVIAPHDLTAAAVSWGKPEKDHVMIAIDLEKSCRDQAKMGLPRDCDLIGSQTGGTEVRVVNRLSSGREVRRMSNVGSEGQYSLCVPLGDGENQIEVSVCTPALPQCVILTTKTFSFSKPEPRVEFLDRDPAHLQFTIKDWTLPKSSSAACEGEIELEWNREAKQKLCPSNGVYAIPNQPVVGVNEMGIGEFRYTFGWGEAVWAKDVASAVQSVHIDHAVINRHLKGMLNKFLESDQFPKMLASFLSGGTGDQKTTMTDVAKEEIAQIRAAIPACSATASVARTKVVGTPKMDRVYLESATLSQDQLALTVTAEHLQIPIQVYKDANQDGQPDKGLLPLRIAFKTLTLKPIFQVQRDANRIVLTTDADDCTFKPASYCKHQPAFFRPGAMTGEATKGGAIVACDSEGQLGGEDLVQSCTDLDIVNMQTGQLSATLIDTLNATLYCDVSAQLSYALRHATVPVARDLTVLGRKWTWAMQAGLHLGGLHIGTDGIQLAFNTQILGDGFYYTASTVRPEPVEGQSGGSTSSPRTDFGYAAPTGTAFGLALKEDLLNQALAALVNLGKPGEGLLDWTFDEQTVLAMGFDFAKDCVTVAGTKPKSALCELRPTVEQLLGHELEKANYYPKQQPLRVTLRGDRALAPHLRFRRSAEGERVVDIDIPNLEIAFAAIDTDPNTEDHPIIAARVTALLSVTLDQIATLSTDPSQLALYVRFRPAESRVVIAPVPGSNRTFLSDAVLLGKLRERVKWALAEAAKPEKALQTILVPKSIALPTAPFGLAEVLLYEDRLQWDVDPLTHAITLTADPVFIQRLLVDGVMQDYRWGE